MLNKIALQPNHKVFMGLQIPQEMNCHQKSKNSSNFRFFKCVFKQLLIFEINSYLFTPSLCLFISQHYSKPAISVQPWFWPDPLKDQRRLFLIQRWSPLTTSSTSEAVPSSVSQYLSPSIHSETELTSDLSPLHGPIPPSWTSVTALPVRQLHFFIICSVVPDFCVVISLSVFQCIFDIS